MNVLSLEHPWAYAAIMGVDVLPIYYKTPTRGRVLVHAPRMSMPKSGNTPSEFLLEWSRFIDGWHERFGSESHVTMTYKRLVELSGGILGALEIVDCVQEHASPWWKGPWGLVIRDAKPLPFIKCPGNAGIWQAQPEIEHAFGGVCL